MQRWALLKPLALLLSVSPALGHNPVPWPDASEGLKAFCSRTTANKQAAIDCSKAIAGDWTSFVQADEAYRRAKLDFSAAQGRLKQIKEELDEEQKRSMAQKHYWTASPDLWSRYDAAYRYALAARGRQDRALAALENAKAEVERHAQTIEVNRRAAEESKIQMQEEEKKRTRERQHEEALNKQLDTQIREREQRELERRQNPLVATDAEVFPEFDFKAECEKGGKGSVAWVNERLDTEASDREISKILWREASQDVRSRALAHVNKVGAPYYFYKVLHYALSTYQEQQRLQGKRPGVNY